MHTTVPLRWSTLQQINMGSLAVSQRSTDNKAVRSWIWLVWPPVGHGQPRDMVLDKALVLGGIRQLAEVWKSHLSQLAPAVALRVWWLTLPKIRACFPMWRFQLTNIGPCPAFSYKTEASLNAGDILPRKLLCWPTVISSSSLFLQGNGKTKSDLPCTIFPFVNLKRRDYGWQRNSAACAEESKHCYTSQEI